MIDPAPILTDEIVNKAIEALQEWDDEIDDQVMSPGSLVRVVLLSAGFREPEEISQEPEPRAE